MAQTAAIFDAIRAHVTELEEICLQDDLDARVQAEGGEEGRVQSMIRSLRREEVASLSFLPALHLWQGGGEGGGSRAFLLG